MTDTLGPDFAALTVVPMQSLSSHIVHTGDLVIHLQ